MTKLDSSKRVHEVRTRGGNSKYRALRLDSGNFAWGSEHVTRKTRLLQVVSAGLRVLGWRGAAWETSVGMEGSYSKTRRSCAVLEGDVEDPPLRLPLTLPAIQRFQQRAPPNSDPRQVLCCRRRCDPLPTVVRGTREHVAWTSRVLLTHCSTPNPSPREARPLPPRTLPTRNRATMSRGSSRSERRTQRSTLSSNSNSVLDASSPSSLPDLDRVAEQTATFSRARSWT